MPGIGNISAVIQLQELHSNSRYSSINSAKRSTGMLQLNHFMITTQVIVGSRHPADLTRLIP